MVGLLSRDDRGVDCQGEVDPRIGDLKLITQLNMSHLSSEIIKNRNQDLFGVDTDQKDPI